MTLAMGVVIVRLYRYRVKLKESEEFNEFGVEKRKIDALERDVVFRMNPMMGTMESMKA